MRAKTIYAIAWLCLIGAMPSIGFGLSMIKKGQTVAGTVLCGLYVLLITVTIICAYYGKKKLADERKRESIF